MEIAWLLGVSRSSYCYEPLGAESQENLSIMRVIDRLYLRRPFFGVHLRRPALSNDHLPRISMPQGESGRVKRPDGRLIH